MIFDSHAHYDDSKFDEDRDTLLPELYHQGVKCIVNIGADMPSSYATLELTRKYPFIYGAVGVHPHEAESMTDENLYELEKLLNEPKIVALGEIGLDYYYDNSPKDIQKKRFIDQLQLAKSLKKPVIIHDRESHEDCLNIIKSEGAKEIGGVFHCFSGSVEMAKDVLKQNFYISIPGTVTFKNARKTIEVVKFLPDDRLLVETDCPYLSPEPNRGKRNNSLNLRFTIEKIAEIKGYSYDKVCELTYKNAQKFYGI